MARVGFIGLGVMGFPMAGHLINSGHNVTVYNRTKSKVSDWTKQYGGKSVDTLSELGTECEFIFCCVGNDDDLRSVTIGEFGVFDNMSKKSLFIDHSTVSAEVAKELANVTIERGFSFIDAPVSGGQLGAQNGILTIMCGGSQENFDRVKPIMDCYSKSCVLLGYNGAGQTTKMVNQICIAGVLQGLAEALLFSEKSGLDTNLVLDVISKGAAGSWQLENRGKTMVKNEFEFGFAVDWMRKDLGICLDEASRIGASLPITAIVDQFYNDIQNIGGGRWDTSSLIARLKKFD